MAANNVVKSPVLTELTLLQHGIDFDPNPENGDFQFCRALARSTRAQCRRQNGKQNQAVAKRFLASFQDLTEVPDDDGFYDDIRAFLEAAHCHSHYPGEFRRKVEKWKEARLSQITAIVSDDSESSESDNRVESPISNANIVLEPRLIKRKPLPPSTVDDVTEGVSAIRITANQQTTTVVSTDDGFDEYNLQKTFALGLTSLRRNGSIRDDSPIIQKIYKHLGPSEQAEGIVYVLEHEKIEGLFKIGSTARTAKIRWEDHGNCYRVDTKVIHQTAGNPFPGALKAEKLAQAILRHHNLQVRKCIQCGRGHKEWFMAPRDKVCSTVTLMEDFVRLPAYVLQDGAWKLSPDAGEIVKELCSFSTEKMQVLIARQETQGTVETGSKVVTETMTMMTATRETVAAQSPPSKANESQEITPDNQDTTGHQGANPARRTSETRTGIPLIAKFGKRLGVIKRRIGRSRETTPEIGEMGSEETVVNIAAPVADSQPNGEEMAVRFLLTLMPKQVKANMTTADEDQSLDFSSLKIGVNQFMVDARADFEDSYHDASNQGDTVLRSVEKSH